MAILAHSLIGGSLVWDKVLLRRPQTRNLVAYVFWLGAISVFGLLLIPFGFHMPPLGVCALAFTAGVLNLVASWLYYKALSDGEASETLAIMGGFSPVATALIAVPLLKEPLGASPVAFCVLVAGGFVMFLSENLNVRQILPIVLTGSVTFGMVNVIEKLVYDRVSFVSGYVIFTVGTFVGALLMLARPSWRRQILDTSENAEPRSRFWYFVNRFVNGLGSFLVYYAISLTAPALVDAVTGVRYAIIFVGAWLLTRWRPQWLKEEFSGRVLAAKIAATVLIIAGLVLLSLSERQQEDAESHQRRAGPAQGHNVLAQQELRQQRLDNVAGRRGRDGEAEIRDGEQGHHGKERDGQGHNAAHHQGVPAERQQHMPQMARAKIVDLAMLLHARGIHQIAGGVAQHDHADEYPLHSSTSG